MTKARLTPLFPPLTAADLDRFEIEYDLVLPDDYRRFLLSTNGATVEPDTVQIPGMPQHGTDLRELYGLGAEVTTSDLRFMPEHRPEILALDMLPIGGDSWGCVFCLDLKRAPAAVYYVDLTWEYTRGNIYRVADSLEDLFNMLHDDTD